MTSLHIMLSFTTSNQIASTISLVEKKKYANAIGNLNTLNQSIHPNIFNGSGKDFSPMIIKDLLTRLIVLVDNYSDKSFSDTLERCLKRWFGFAVSFCPLTLYKIINEISQEKLTPKGYAMLTNALASCIQRFSKESQFEKLPLLTKLIFSCQANDLIELPDSAMELFIENSDENDALALLSLLITNEDNTKHSLKIIHKNSQKAMEIIIKNGSLKLISSILKKLPREYKFDYKILLVKLESEIVMETQNLENALEVLYLLVDWIEEENYDSLLRITNALKEKLEKDDCKEMNLVYKIIIKAEKKNIISYEDLFKFIDLSNEKRFLYSAKVIIDNIDKKENQERIFDLLERLIIRRVPKETKNALKCIINNFELLNEIDKEKLEKIIYKIFNPMPLDEINRGLIIELFSKLPYQEIFASILPKIIYKIVNNNRTVQQNELLENIIRKYRLELNPLEIDWFSQFSHLNFKLIQDMPITLVINFLDSKVVNPDYLSYPLEHICKNAKITGPITFLTVLSMILYFLRVIGLIEKENIIDGYKIHISKVKTFWIHKCDIRDMAESVSYNIPESRFGKAFQCCIEALTILLHHFSLNEDYILTLLLISKLIAPLFETEASKLMSILCKELNKVNSQTNISKKNKKLAVRLKEDFFDTQISYNDPISVAISAFDAFGPSALFQCKRHVMSAVSCDPTCARLYQSYLDQPLPLMPTFLYFQDEKHKEWREECKKHFGFNEWVLSTKDYYLLMDDIPEVDLETLDQHHLEIYNKLTNREIKKSSEEDKQIDIIEYERKFTFNDNVDIKEGLPIYKDDPTFYRTISYLWYSEMPLPEEISPENLQEFALENYEDSRVVLGYLTFALRNNLKVNIKEWTEKIKVIQGNDNSILAASFLLLNIHLEEEEEPSYLTAFISKSLNIIGNYSYTQKSLIDAFYSEKDINWYLIYSIIKLNVKKYTEIEPLIALEYLSNFDEETIFMPILNTFSEKIDSNKYIHLIHAVSSSLLLQSQEYNLIRNLPRTTLYHYRLMSLYDPTRIKDTHVNISPKLIDKLLSRLSRQNIVSYQFLQFCFSLVLNEDQYTKLLEILSQFCKFSPDHFRVIFQGNESYEQYVIQNFLFGYPSSYIRGLLRSYYKHVNEDIHSRMKYVIEQYLEQKIDSSIYPSLCYSDLGKIGMKPWDKATIYDKIRMKICDLETLMSAYFHMSKPVMETIYIFDCIGKYSKKELFQTKSWPTADQLKLDFAKSILKTISDEKTNLIFIKDAFCIISKYIPITITFPLINEDKFLQNSNLINAYYLFYLYESTSINNRILEVKEDCSKIHCDSAQLFEDEEKKNIFKEFNYENIKKALLYNE